MSSLGFVLIITVLLCVFHFWGVYAQKLCVYMHKKFEV